jgi:hypothetical protein
MVASLRVVAYFLTKVNKVFFLVCVASFGSAFGQGQIRFETRGASLDAPVLWRGSGPGPNFTAQLYLLDQSGNPVTPLNPTTTFRAATAGDPLASRYVNPVDVTVSNVPPGSTVSLIMRAWRTSLGSYKNAVSTCDFGQSAPFTITLGGDGVPPAPLRTLQAFTMGYLECPRSPQKPSADYRDQSHE